MAIDLKSGINAGKKENSPETCKIAGSGLITKLDVIRLYPTLFDPYL